jgi:hypothetical protein
VYIVFGKELANVSRAFAEALARKPQPWKMLVVIGVGFVIAWVLEYLVVRLEITSWMGAAQVGV